MRHDAVEVAFRAAARALVAERTCVLVAVSGGADSVALLDLFVRSATPRGLRLVVAHLDHGLRRGSSGDRRFVEIIAQRLGLPVIADRRPVGALRRREESPEEAARRVRRGFLLEAAATVGAETVALGHTLDDQAETILLRLARGTGPSGAAGMAAAGPGPFVRPLLGVTREALRAYLRRRRRTFREDPSNASLRFDRNRVRRLVVPVLADVNPGAARHLVEAAARIREDAALLDDLAARAFGRLARRTGDRRLALDARRLASLPLPLALRVARIALDKVGSPPRGVSSRHLGGIVDLARGPRGRSIDLPGRVTARRREDVVAIGPREGLW